MFSELSLMSATWKTLLLSDRDMIALNNEFWFANIPYVYSILKVSKKKKKVQIDVFMNIAVIPASWYAIQ